MPSRVKHVIIYTDGSCSGNPGPGGWAAILRWRARERVLTGSELHTTNNRMELSAALEALRALKEPCRVSLYTDSAYMEQAFNRRWIRRWQQNGWRTKRGEPVSNEDLWIGLLEQAARHQIRWIKVKGHAGETYNERVDKLAVEAMKAANTG